MSTPFAPLPCYVRLVSHAGSRFRLWWLDKLLRVAVKRAFKYDAEIPFLRDRQARLDLKLTRIDPEMKVEAIGCNGTPAEWITVPESRNGKVIFYIHGGAWMFKFPRLHHAMVASWCRRIRARDPQGLGNGQLAALLEQRREAPAFDVRHRDVLGAVDLAEVVDAHHVLVRDLARDEQFAFEPLLEVRRQRHIRARLGPDRLERHHHAEFGVPRLVDRAHATRAEQPDHAVARAERLSGNEHACAPG